MAAAVLGTAAVGSSAASAQDPTGTTARAGANERDAAVRAEFGLRGDAEHVRNVRAQQQGKDDERSAFH